MPIDFSIILGLLILFLSVFRYWKTKTNRFDLFVILVGFIWVFLLFKEPNNPAVYDMGGVVVIARFCTVIGKHTVLKVSGDERMIFDYKIKRHDFNRSEQYLSAPRL